MFLKKRIVSAAGLIMAVSFATSASGFDLYRAKTEAAIRTSAAGDHTILLNFAAELINGIPDLVKQDLEVGWGEVGGIDPQPFRILIPAGCFVSGSRGYRVRDFSACDVQVLFLPGVPPDSLSIIDFDARVVARDDGSYRFDMVAQFYPPDPIYPVLGAVGGAAVRIGIGSESSMVFPVSTETVSGISPEPF
jgi:hypothetical protein